MTTPDRPPPKRRYRLKKTPRVRAAQMKRRDCLTCVSPHRARIDYMLALGGNVQAIAKKFDVSVPIPGPSGTRCTPLRARVKFIPFDQAKFRRKEGARASDGQGAPLLESLVSRPMLFRRNDVAWLSASAWRAETRIRDMAAFRQAKVQCDDELISRVGELLAALIYQVRGRQCADAVTAIPCGHSRRHDCFGKQVAQAVANSLDLPFVQVFADRFCSGVSHPKEYRKLPPLEQVSPAPRSVLVADDLATSGWHLEESLTALRTLGSAASGFVWISSTVSRQ